ncbi:MAG: hypothetical protein AAGU27_05805 [Dehalobacterium sp.]
MSNLDGHPMPDEQSGEVLLTYCRALNRINQEQGDAVRQEDLERLQKSIADFNRLKENIDAQLVLFRNDPKDKQEHKEFRQKMKALLHKIVQENEENIRLGKDLLNQIKQEMKNNHQIGKYVQKAGAQQAKIIDKSI